MNDPDLSNRLSDSDIKALFSAIDQKDALTLSDFLSLDAVFRFGNADPIKGRQPVTEVVQGFFDSIQALRHDLKEILRDGSSIICRGEVTYTRHDGSQLKVPFMNYFGIANGLIREYQIYVDASALYTA
ncbi:MAG: nuclear transport factor 2 family protein [Candidatus Thiodiazotropha sp.]|jgi:ketosteroid isomerase-like protein